VEEGESWEELPGVELLLFFTGEEGDDPKEWGCRKFSQFSTMPSTSSPPPKGL